jgi:galactose oxidase
MRSSWRVIRAVAVLVLLSLSSHALPESVGGQWGPVLLWPHVAVSMANLPDGRILTYASNEPNAFPGSLQDEYTHAAVWDPETGQLMDVPHPSHDMFCAAMVTLESGETFVMGGRNQGDSPWVSYYDFNNDQWIQFDASSQMNRGRWYASAVYIGTGEVLIAAGVGGGVNPERFTPGGGWTLLTGIDLTTTILEHGTRDGSGSWPLLQLDKSGKIFHHGATTTMNTLDPFGGPQQLGTITDLGTHLASDGNAPDWFPDEGVSVLYDEGKILVAGGSTSPSDNTAVSNAFSIDINGPAPSLTAVASMNLPRQFQNEVMLPTGHVLVVGGNTNGNKFTDASATLDADAWDPDMDLWTLWNPQNQARAYHSTALLLLDGRVLSAGGGLGNDACPGGIVPPLLPGECDADHWNAEIFSPPYLFNTVLRVGRTFNVRATPGLSGFSMVRMSATTHTMNTDQRFLGSSVTEIEPGSYDITLHGNQHVLVPGCWMLFAMDGDVPSIAKAIQIVNDGTPRGPPIPGLRNNLNESVLYQVVAEDPDGNHHRAGERLHGELRRPGGPARRGDRRRGWRSHRLGGMDLGSRRCLGERWEPDAQRSLGGDTPACPGRDGQWRLVGPRGSGPGRPGAWCGTHPPRGALPPVVAAAACFQGWRSNVDATFRPAPELRPG